LDRADEGDENAAKKGAVAIVRRRSSVLPKERPPLERRNSKGDSFHTRVPEINLLDVARRDPSDPLSPSSPSSPFSPFSPASTTDGNDGFGERQPKRDSELKLPAEMVPKRDSVLSVNQSKRDSAVSQNQSKRDSAVSQNQSKRDSAVSPHQPKRGSAVSENQSKRGTAVSENQPNRDSLVSEFEPKRESVATERPPNRDDVTRSSVTTRTVAFNDDTDKLSFLATAVNQDRRKTAAGALAQRTASPRRSLSLPGAPAEGAARESPGSPRFQGPRRLVQRVARRMKLS
jgi:hypothetical protein